MVTVVLDRGAVTGVLGRVVDGAGIVEDVTTVVEVADVAVVVAALIAAGVVSG